MEVDVEALRLRKELDFVNPVWLRHIEELLPQLIQVFFEKGIIHHLG